VMCSATLVGEALARSNHVDLAAIGTPSLAPIRQARRGCLLCCRRCRLRRPHPSAGSRRYLRWGDRRRLGARRQWRAAWRGFSALPRGKRAPAVNVADVFAAWLVRRVADRFSDADPIFDNRDMLGIALNADKPHAVLSGNDQVRSRSREWTE
jgi:hypothetical protein